MQITCKGSDAERQDFRDALPGTPLVRDRTAALPMATSSSWRVEIGALQTGSRADRIYSLGSVQFLAQELQCWKRLHSDTLREPNFVPPRAAPLQSSHQERSQCILGTEPSRALGPYHTNFRTSLRGASQGPGAPCRARNAAVSGD